MGDGGFLMNFENFKDYSRVFVNPGAGMISTHCRKASSFVFCGTFTHNGIVTILYSRRTMGYRDSFINMKLGLLFGK